MTCNPPTARLVSHCSTTRTARTSRTGGLMTFTTRIKSCLLDNPQSPPQSNKLALLVMG